MSLLFINDERRDTNAEIQMTNDEGNPNDQMTKCHPCIAMPRGGSASPEDDANMIAP
jgi:hypothetical protein